MLSAQELRELDRAVDRMATGDRGTLEILGAGEITCVVEWRGHACKRLPAFHDEARVGAYGALLEAYVTRLRTSGIAVVETALGSCVREDGSISAYVVQPRVSGASLLPSVMRATDVAGATALFRAVLDAIDRSVTRELGLDPQVSNWSCGPGGLVLLDVTTPLMRDASGADRLDTEVFVGALPAAMRPAVRWWFVADLLDRFFDPRAIVLDAIANLTNNRLEHLSQPFLEEANRRLLKPIAMSDVLAYRRREAFLWGVIRRALRLERVWQQRVMRTTHPTLLPFEFQRRE